MVIIIINTIDGAINNINDNYYGYLERMDYAIQTLYSKGNATLKDEYFEIQRNI